MFVTASCPPSPKCPRCNLICHLCLYLQKAPSAAPSRREALFGLLGAGLGVGLTTAYFKSEQRQLRDWLLTVQQHRAGSTGKQTSQWHLQCPVNTACEPLFVCLCAYSFPPLLCCHAAMDPEPNQ
jgi:hypothetical protein